MRCKHKFMPIDMAISEQLAIIKNQPMKYLLILLTAIILVSCQQNQKNEIDKELNKEKSKFKIQLFKYIRYILIRNLEALVLEAKKEG